MLTASKTWGSDKQLEQLYISRVHAQALHQQVWFTTKNMRKILKDWHAKEQNDNDCNKAILSINIMRSWNTTETWETPNI